MSTRVNIGGGDNQLELFCQLINIGRNSVNDRFKMKVWLTGEGGLHDIEVRIFGLEAEDGSGNKWLVRGKISVAPEWMYDIFRDNSGSFYGFYNCKNRRGWMKPGIGR